MMRMRDTIQLRATRPSYARLLLRRGDGMTRCLTILNKNVPEGQVSLTGCRNDREEIETPYLTDACEGLVCTRGANQKSH